MHLNLGPCELAVGRKPCRRGYVRVIWNGSPTLAHRVAWMKANGPIADGLSVCHRCDNPTCIRVSHLFLGTPLDNNRDRHSKGRSRGLFGDGRPHPATERSGSRHWRARLSDADVLSIRSRSDAGESRESVAKSFHVNPATISRIARRIWRKEVSLA